MRATLICFVLTHAPSATHTFCSRYDFGPWPLLAGLTPHALRDDVHAAFRGTKAVMMNGFVFDELSADVVHDLAEEARASGAAVFFDPGAQPCKPLDHDPRRGSSQTLPRDHSVRAGHPVHCT